MLKKSMKQAKRRSEKERIVAKAKRLFRGRNLDYAARVADNITVCSCWMCGNPRRRLKQKTIAETLADDWRRLEADWAID